MTSKLSADENKSVVHTVLSMSACFVEEFRLPETAERHCQLNEGEEKYDCSSNIINFNQMLLGHLLGLFIG